MSLARGSSLNDEGPEPTSSNHQPDANQAVAAQASSPKAYKGFFAGVFSGVAKLTVGHPFDTIKVRLQTTDKARFRGPVDCTLQTIRKEGVRGLYKGATPPLVGWMFMDSLMLGSLTLYRRLLHENVFTPSNAWILMPSRLAPSTAAEGDVYAEDVSEPRRLPALGHAIAGTMAGWTVSFIAAPVEHVKARLQIQYAAGKKGRLYSGPVHCVTSILRTHGLPGLYRGLPATLLFRTFFFVMWGSYDLLSRLLATHTALSSPAINFWAGGASAQLFWLAAYPSDVVKQRLMTGPLERGRRVSWRAAAREVWRRDGMRGFWRGFGPCFLRAFPANAVALVVFEGVMRGLPE